MGPRHVLPWLFGAAVSVPLLGYAAPANGAGRLLRPSGSSLGVVEARVAQSLAPNWATLWVSIRVSGPGRFALVFPLPNGTAVDPALDDWLAALDQATAPRIRPPLGVPVCGATTTSSVENTGQAYAAGLSPQVVATFADLGEVQAFAGSQMLQFGASDAEALGVPPLGYSFLGVAYEAKGQNDATETLRFALPVSSAGLPLRLLDVASGFEKVTLFTLASSRVRVGGADELEKDQLSTTWNVLLGATDYRDERHALLSSKQGGAWLTEASSKSSLFGWTVLPGGAGAIEPALRTYLSGAKAHSPGVGGVDACLGLVSDAQESGKLGATVSRACAPASLALLPGGPAPCAESPGAGEVGAQTLRCGSADDIAFALSGLNADEVHLTRLSGVVGKATPEQTSVEEVASGDVSPLATATGLDASGCGSSGGHGGMGGYGGGSSGYGGSTGYGATAGEQGYVPPDDSNVAVDVQCWFDGSNSCNGDSSSSSDGSDSCGGDSSSSSSTDGDTCGGDSSGSSDGDTCGGDSSNGSADGDTCSGSSSSGDEGATCSGDSSGGDSCSSGSSSGSGGGDCSVSAPRRPRVRLSVLTLLLTAVALPIRRFGRRRRRQTPGRKPIG